MQLHGRIQDWKHQAESYLERIQGRRNRNSQMLGRLISNPGSLHSVDIQEVGFMSHHIEERLCIAFAPPLLVTLILGKRCNSLRCSLVRGRCVHSPVTLAHCPVECYQHAKISKLFRIMITGIPEARVYLSLVSIRCFQSHGRFSRMVISITTEL